MSICTTKLWVLISAVQHHDAQMLAEGFEEALLSEYLSLYAQLLCEQSRESILYIFLQTTNNFVLLAKEHIVK